MVYSSMSGRLRVLCPDGLCLHPVETDSTVSRFPFKQSQIDQLNWKPSFAYVFFFFFFMALYFSQCGSDEFVVRGSVGLRSHQTMQWTTKSLNPVQDLMLWTHVWGLRHYSDKVSSTCGTLYYCSGPDINKSVFYWSRWSKCRKVLQYTAVTVLFITGVTTEVKV